MNFVKAKTINMQSQETFGIGNFKINNQDFGEIIETWGDNLMFSVFLTYNHMKKGSPFWYFRFIIARNEKIWYKDFFRKY